MREAEVYSTCPTIFIKDFFKDWKEWTWRLEGCPGQANLSNLKKKVHKHNMQFVVLYKILVKKTIFSIGFEIDQGVNFSSAHF